MKCTTTIMSLVFGAVALAAPPASFQPEPASGSGSRLQNRFTHTPDSTKTNLCGEANPVYRTSEASPKASDCWEIPTKSSPANIPGYWTLNPTEAGSGQWFSLGTYGTCEFKIRGKEAKEIHFGTYDVKFYIDAHTRSGYDEEGRVEVVSAVGCETNSHAEWAVAHV
ncbi:hypothetical protein B0T21DRAFT_407745 [Apiosordaria backusii]|uniref:Ecp2 effector protein-like domain-containing protein n=1 Tax=Apiosordaria backusii TaxID=314023 RepID=A0AA40ESG0_9PEZI|nr:hypothetical protein B0T21DRAFT_407745 [Apiosordaria backusii]